MAETLVIAYRLLETGDIKILRNITGKTLINRKKCENIKRAWKVENINEWVHGRKKEWNDHTNQMTDNKIVRDISPVERRSVGSDGVTTST